MLAFLIPIAGAFGIGLYCRRRALLSAEAVEGIKYLVTTFFLPLVCFRMFSQARFDRKTFFLIAMSFLLYTGALGIGFCTRKIMGKYGKYYPFLLSSAEGGMLGIGLFQMLYGADQLPYLAGIDLGCGIFVFSIFLPLLIKKTREGGQDGVAEKRFRIWEMPVFQGCLLGIAFQATGLSGWVERIDMTQTLLACINGFTEMVTPLMLVAIGYEFTVDREVLVPAVKTCVCRLLVMGVFFLTGAATMSAFGVGEPLNYYALLLESALPATFLVAMFAKEEGEKRYINTHLSIHALLTLVIAIVMKACLS